MAARNGAVRCLFALSCKQFDHFKPLVLRQRLVLRREVKRQFPYNHVSFLAPFSLKQSFSLSSGILYRDQSTSTTLDNLSKSDLGCPICSQNLTFTYKDVLLLSQFLSPEGNILNRRVTGVCRKQQRKLEKAIEISRRLGLIPRKPPIISQQEG